MKYIKICESVYAILVWIFDCGEGGHRWDYDDYDVEKKEKNYMVVWDKDSLSQLDFPCKYNMHTYIYLRNGEKGRKIWFYIKNMRV